MRENKPVRWLQLSDLHIYLSTEWNIMIDSYKELAKVFHPDFIVVTGDFCHLKHNKTYKDALSFLNALVKIFSVDKKDFFLVPGNHDTGSFPFRDEIITTIKTEIEDNPDVYLNYCSPKCEPTANLHNAFTKYNEFIRAFYEDSISDERVNAPSDVYSILWRNKLNIVSLNTALISNGNAERYEIVDVQRLSQLVDNIPKNLPTIVLAHNDIHALVKSHQLQLERLLTMINTRAYLCGDAHKISRTIANKYDINHQIPCIVCGKSASETGDHYSDVCVIGYTWEGNETKVEVYKWLNNTAETPYQFIRSDMWLHNIDKPYSFIMANDQSCNPGLTDRMKETWETFLLLFDEEDQLINEKLGENGFINKTGYPEKFSSTKIMASLIKIGIPFPAIAEITKNAIEIILAWTNIKKEDETLSTKRVREIVLDAIKQLGGENWPTEKVGRWCTKYIHRYGHNNKIIQIFNIPNSLLCTEPVSDANYKFIKTVFLPDLFKSVTPALDINNITNSQKTKMADEVIAFINECDLYRIEYNTLKRMVHEIATQPPHPWLINNEQRNALIEYDSEAVKSNLQQIKICEDNNTDIPYTVIVELLHHTSSMMLDKYFSFCGCDDLDAFSILYQYFKKIIKARMSFGEWDKILSDAAYKRLYEDFQICKIDFMSYYEIISAITPNKAQKIDPGDFLALIKKFATVSLDIINKLQEIETVAIPSYSQFVQSDWGNYQKEEINRNIGMIISLLFPSEQQHGNAKQQNVWWTRYVTCCSSHIKNMKPNVFVIVLDDSPFEPGLIKCLTGKTYKDSCNTIFFVKEIFSDKKESRKEFITLLLEMNLGEYTPVLLDKKDLHEILVYPGKKNICFDGIVYRQLIN